MYESQNRLVLSPPKPKNSMNTETENPPTDSDNAPSAEAVDSNALFACPFCGGDPKLIRVGNDHTRKRSVRIECSTFGCTVKMTVGAIRYSHDWCENVIREKWNTRLNANSPVLASEPSEDCEQREFNDLALPQTERPRL